MPYPKDPDLYPEEFRMLFIQAQEKEIEIPCESPQIASNLRHRLHAYRRAAERAKHPGWTRLRNVMVQVDSNILKLTPSNLMSSIQKALGEPDNNELEQYWRKAAEGGDENGKEAEE